jgi:hypothetical protein
MIPTLLLLSLHVVVIVPAAAVVFVFALPVKQLHQNMVLFAADANCQQTQIPLAF